MAKDIDQELEKWKKFFKPETLDVKLEFWLILCIKNNNNTLKLITDNPCKTIMEQKMSFQDIENAIKRLEFKKMIEFNGSHYSLTPKLNYSLRYLLFKIPKLGSKSDILQTLKSMKECKIENSENCLDQLLNVSVKLTEKQKLSILLNIGINNATTFFAWIVEQIISL